MYIQRHNCYPTCGVAIIGSRRAWTFERKNYIHRRTEDHQLYFTAVFADLRDPIVLIPKQEVLQANLIGIGLAEGKDIYLLSMSCGIPWECAVQAGGP